MTHLSIIPAGIAPACRNRTRMAREVISPIEQAHARLEPALPNSPESKSRLAEYRDPSLMSWRDILATQPGPLRRLAGMRYQQDQQFLPYNPGDQPSPFHPIRTDRFELPTEAAKLRDAGIPTLNLDIPIADDMDIEATVAGPATGLPGDERDDFDGPAPYVFPDPRLLERLDWERMTTTVSTPVRIRRKMHNGRDIVVVDKAGTSVRPMRTVERKRLDCKRADHKAKGAHTHLVKPGLFIVFDPPKPHNHRLVTAIYQRRLTGIHGGEYPTFEKMAEYANLCQYLKMYPPARQGLTAAPIEPTDRDAEGPWSEVEVDDLVGPLLAKYMASPHDLSRLTDWDRMEPEDQQALLDWLRDRLTPEARERRTRWHDARGPRSTWDRSRAQVHFNDLVSVPDLGLDL